MNDLRISLVSFEVKNFKSITSRTEYIYMPLTILSGEYGTGKSTFISAVSFFRDIILNGTNYNYKVKCLLTNAGIRFRVKFLHWGTQYEYTCEMNNDGLIFLTETLSSEYLCFARDRDGRVKKDVIDRKDIATINTRVSFVSALGGLGDWAVIKDFFKWICAWEIVPVLPNTEYAYHTGELDNIYIRFSKLKKNDKIDILWDMIKRTPGLMGISTGEGARIIVFSYLDMTINMYDESCSAVRLLQLFLSLRREWTMLWIDDFNSNIKTDNMKYLTDKIKAETNRWKQAFIVKNVIGA